MDALYGLVGVFVGWVLATITEWLRRRREGRAAASLVMAELLHNEDRLQQLIDLKIDAPIGDAVRHLAWDTYGVALVSVIDKDDILSLIRAYHVAQSAESSTNFTRDALEDEMEALRNATEQFREAQRADRDVEMRELGKELERRAKTNVPLLKKAQDDLLDHIRQSVLPAVSDARSRLERRTGLK